MEYQRNAGNNSGGIPAGIPVEYRRNAGNNSGGIPAGIPFEYWRNAGNNPAEFRLEMSGIPGEYQGNTSGIPAIIPADSSGIPAESARHLPGIPGLFLLGLSLVFGNEMYMSNSDKQNEDAAVRILSPSVHKCLADSCDDRTKATQVYLA